MSAMIANWLVLWPAALAGAADTLPGPDITVAADGSGDFATVQAALASVARDNRQRVIILVKDGLYREKVRVEAPFLTLRGQSREGTRIEFAQRASEYTKRPGDPGRAVINLDADDFVLENLTVANTAGVVGEHAFTIYGGRCDRTVIVDCDVLSEGADTVSLWDGQRGRYYHARSHFRGAVDFLCPRGWCYVTDCTFFETKPSAATWHDGHSAREMKFVLRNCKFDGVPGWYLARHHHDAQFYFLDCLYSRSMIDKAPYRVIYPLGNAAATAKDLARNEELNKTNLWGERAYYSNCHHEGGDYAWHADNLSTAPGAPSPQRITASWTFGDTWNPERSDGPKIVKVRPEDGRIAVRFSENVTVKGKPRLVLKGGGFAAYQSGSGTETLLFAAAAGAADGDVVAAVDLNGGAVIATGASAKIRAAELALDEPAVIPAFPGAEGFGARATGGRGGTVSEVTNLDDSGPGSLRDAAAGPNVTPCRSGAGHAECEECAFIPGRNEKDRPRQIRGSATRSTDALSIGYSMMLRRFDRENKAFDDLGITSVYIRASS